MQEAASMPGNISEVPGDLNMTNIPYSDCANIIGPEIAVAGQEPMTIGLLVSALDKRPSRIGKLFRAPEHVVRQKLMPGMGSASLRRRGLSFAFPFTVVTEHARRQRHEQHAVHDPAHGRAPPPPVQRRPVSTLVRRAGGALVSRHAAPPARDGLVSR
jgi:hypothetical protein